MENSIYVGLSRQVALQSEMDTVANNIANVNTPGFRAQYMMYKEYVQSPSGISEPISMVEDYGQYLSNKPGSMKMTGNPLDIALQGPGFFSVQNGAETMYTRAGNFTTNATGALLTSDGKPVLDGGGGPITIPQGSREIRIAEDGTMSNQDGAFARLAITEFNNIQKLKPVGEGLYDGKDAVGTAATETIAQSGMLEGSNVNAVREMTRMIDVSRAYQSAVRLLQSEHERQLTMIQRLSRGS